MWFIFFFSVLITVRLTFIVLYLVFYLLSWVCFLAILLSSSLYTLSFRASWAVFGSYYFFYTNTRNYVMSALFIFSGLLPSVFFFTKSGLFVFALSGWSWVLLSLVLGNFFFTIVFYLYLFRYKNFLHTNLSKFNSLELVNYNFLRLPHSSCVMKKTKNYYLLFFYANFLLFLLLSSLLYFGEFFLIFYSFLCF